MCRMSEYLPRWSQRCDYNGDQSWRSQIFFTIENQWIDNGNGHSKVITVDYWLLIDF